MATVLGYDTDIAILIANSKSNREDMLVIILLSAGHSVAGHNLQTNTGKL